MLTDEPQLPSEPPVVPPAPPRVDSGQAVDAQSPWLGLASYSEETRAFFYGRDEETAELVRRVQRKLLTVLFGQSGLGKTSLLRAGLVPNLRPDGYCPIYVRIDYSGRGLSPAAQVKQATEKAIAAVGEWTQPGVAQPGESLWEFFHHREDVVLDPNGRALTLLLIFDQFEEVFTLAQTDDAGRARAQEFLEQLADLVENRPPVALEDDEAAVDRYDFARADYRVLIALREDYLANLESLKSLMPSITQNRLRLARMNGVQAIEAVVRPGGGLVSESVAEQIVRFVAGAEKLNGGEVEPSLLSLVCRELNEARRVQGHAVISADLLAGSRKTILSEFYDRTLSDQPDGVRHYIEDDLLTDSGYRESIAEERVRAAFNACGAPDALAKLVDRRLLRMEERLDVRRVELTHDVLCGVVKSSRDVRAERLALAQAKRAALRQRWVIGSLAVLVLTMVIWATNTRSARREQLAQASRTDYIFGSNLIDSDKVADGLAYLTRAAEADPSNHLVAPRLISTLVYRNFPLANGPELAHPGPINVQGVFDGGARLLATSIDQRFAYVWDTATRERLLPPIELAAGEARAVNLATDPLGQRLAAARSDGSVAVWDLRSGEPSFAPLRHATDSSQVDVEFSPDGRWLVSFGDDGAARIWETATGSLTATLAADAWISSVEFSPDMTRVATTMIASAGWRVWSFPDGKPLTQSMPVAAQGNKARFSPDGKLLIVNDNRGAQVWDWVKGERVGPHLDHDDRSDFSLFFPDGRWVVTTSADRTLRVWSAQTGLLIKKIALPGIAWSASLAKDGRRLLVPTTDGSVRVWDGFADKPVTESIRAGNITSAVFTPDGQELWTGGRDGMARRWSLGEGAAQPFRVKGLANRLSANQGVVDLRISGSIAQRIDLRSGQPVGDPIALPKPPTSAWLSPLGRYLIAATAEGESFLWDLESQPVAGFPVENPWFSRGTWPAVAFDAQERWVAIERIRSLNQGSSLIVRSLPDGALRFEPIGPLFGFVLPTPSPDGLWVAAGMFNGVARIWNAETGAQVGADMRLDTQINATAFSPDGKLLMAAGNGGALRVWDAAQGKPVTESLIHGIRVNAAQFARDGARVLTTDWESALIWDTGSFKPRTDPMQGQATLASTIFDNAQTRIYGVMIDGAARVWDASSGLKIVESFSTEGPVPYVYGLQAISDASFLRINSGYNSATIFAVPETYADTQAPDWLLDLALLVGGKKVADTGSFVPIDVPSAAQAYADIAARLDALPDDAPYVAWGRWFLAPRAQRPIAPGFTLTSAEAAAFR